MLQSAGGHNPAAILPGAGSQIDDRIRRPNGFLVVFDHQNAVAPIPQGLEGIDQDAVIPGMQADGGLIQNIANPGQIGAQLGGQTNPLGLAAGQGVAAA